MVYTLRRMLGNSPRVVTTMTGHSGGGSFMFGLIEGQAQVPAWLERIAFLDANYNFEARHVDKLTAWLGRDTTHTLVCHCV